MNRAYGILALVLGLVVGFRVVTLLMGQGDDRTMIQETLRQSLQASREGKSGSVLEALSSSLKVNDNEAEGNFSQIAKYIRDNKPDVEVANQEPIVTGDEARITSPITVRASLPLVGERSMTVKDVVLVFKRETGRAYLVFPTKKWRLAEVQAPPMALDTFSIQ